MKDSKKFNERKDSKPKEIHVFIARRKHYR